VSQAVAHKLPVPAILCLFVFLRETLETEEKTHTLGTVVLFLKKVICCIKCIITVKQRDTRKRVLVDIPV
jgi:hypothetical protein